MSRSRKHDSRTTPPPRGRSIAIRAFGFCAAAVAIGLLIFWSLKRGSGPQSPYGNNDAEAVRSGHSIPENEQTVFAQYGRSASCRECHQQAFDLWQHSHHGLAERPVQPAADRAAFDPPRVFQHGTQSSAVSWTGNQARVTAVGLSGQPETLSVVRVIGESPLRQFLVAFPGGRLQTLEATWDPRSNDWFNVYGAEDRRPGEWGHWTGRGMNWNNMCAACHNTRVRKNYDATNDVYRTTMAEPTVSCESCHGPLKAHNDWQKQFGKSGKKDPTVLKLTGEQLVDSCGFCHARRGDLTGDFKPGDRFTDHQRLTIVDHSDVYYPDGQVRDEDYEYAAFLGSRMHARGVTCADCHEVHSMKTHLPGNWLCMRCHNGSFTNAPIIEPLSHSRHQVFGYDMKGVLTNADLTAYQPGRIKETGGECVNCHMPQTAYMQRHWRHDHGFTSPDPLLTKQHGIPNACNRCHQDKDTDWALKYCEEWYGAKMDRPVRRRAQIIATARNGDPAAREPLMKILAAEEIPYWRAVAAGLLSSWSGEPSVNAALLLALNDTNALVRAEAVEALGPLAGTDHANIAAALRARLDDPARNVRVAAAWALRSNVDPSSKAGRELLHYLDLNADQPAGRMQIGAYALARGDATRALEHYRKAVEWDPNSAAVRHDYAVVLSGLDHGQEALEQLQAACRLEPRNAEFRYKLALAWNEVGRLDQTIAGLENAVQLDPRHARAWYNLGLALNSAGRADEALAALVRAESVDAADPRAPYARATILAAQGRTAEARQAARRALEIQPGFAPARELLSRLP